jgi:hypothetical protein
VPVAVGKNQEASSRMSVRWFRRGGGRDGEMQSWLCCRLSQDDVGFVWESPAFKARIADRQWNKNCLSRLL